MVHGHLRIRPFSVPPSPRTPVRPDSRHRSCTVCSICAARGPSWASERAGDTRAGRAGDTRGAQGTGAGRDIRTCWRPPVRRCPRVSGRAGDVGGSDARVSRARGYPPGQQNGRITGKLSEITEFFQLCDHRLPKTGGPGSPRAARVGLSRCRRSATSGRHRRRG